MKMHRLLGATVIIAASVGMTFAASAEVVAYQIVDDGIPKSLTGKAGDAKAGRKVAYNRKTGNCLACHKLPIPEQQFHGEVGPDLKGVASRYSEAEIRLRVVDSKKMNSDTIMPAFYRDTGFTRLQKKWVGKSILKAQEVEDLVAYLMTLKE
jgi:L-cysteine S-thiosulfotransferase